MANFHTVKGKKGKKKKKKKNKIKQVFPWWKYGARRRVDAPRALYQTRPCKKEFGFYWCGCPKGTHRRGYI